MILRGSFGNKIFQMCYITKNKATGIACLTFKCKLAFPTIFNDIHKRVLLILSIYQMVLYRCLHENKVFTTVVQAMHFYDGVWKSCVS